MRLRTLMGLALLMGLTGCAELACVGGCHRHAENSTSPVDFLYPKGMVPPANPQPQLHLPLRVGLAFLPGSGSERENGLNAAHKEALLQEIRNRFISRRFVAEIVVIPDYYFRGQRGFEGLAAIRICGERSC
jgi:rhombotail lipoprotein